MGRVTLFLIAALLPSSSVQAAGARFQQGWDASSASPALPALILLESDTVTACVPRRAVPVI